MVMAMVQVKEGPSTKVSLAQLSFYLDFFVCSPETFCKTVIDKALKIIVFTDHLITNSKWNLVQCDQIQKIYVRMQAFIFGPANLEFRQSLLTCRAKIPRRSEMSWFHINLKYNVWLREAMILPAKLLCWEYP